MFQNDKIWVGLGTNPTYLLLNQANRHGLIAGASGTGKTVTLKVLAEGFSKAGVPVFMADVKGDITGMCQPGTPSESMAARIEKFGIQDWNYEGCPVRFWDMLGGQGIPVRITISDMGPTLLSRLLNLTDVQEGVLNIVFRIADDKQMLLIDLKDLRAMLNYVSTNAAEYELTYGKVSSQSVGAILRSLIAIEDQGGNIFFGEPALDINDWFAVDSIGQGYINVLNAAKLIQSPQIYAMFLLWMMSTLFDRLPEVGDCDKPKFVFFFDEAHLLFNNMPKELLSKIIQVVKLIRSKGVGIYFITQSPSDIPDEVLAQLSNRIQHALRAYTPAEQKAVRAAAASFRPNPEFKSEDAILECGTGEALVSFLNEGGQPSIVERCKILPAQCLMGAASEDAFNYALSNQSALMTKYGNAIDRESAYEIITGVQAEAAAQAEQAKAEAEAVKQAAAEEKQRLAEEAKAEKELERQRIAQEKEFERKRIAQEKELERQRIAQEKELEKARIAAEKELERQRIAKERQQQQLIKDVSRTANSIMGQIGREASRQIVRGIFGGRK